MAKSWPRLIPRTGLDLVRVLLGLVFLLAVTYKATHFPEFSALVSKMSAVSWLPLWGRGAVSGAVGALEWYLGILLLLDIATRIAAAYAALSIFFFTVVVSTDFGHVSSKCGCFWNLGGIVPQTVWWIIVRNLVLISAYTYLSVRSTCPANALDPPKLREGAIGDAGA